MLSLSLPLLARLGGIPMNIRKEKEGWVKNIDGGGGSGLQVLTRYKRTTTRCEPVNVMFDLQNVCTPVHVIYTCERDVHM